MRRHIRFLAGISLCLLAAGCGHEGGAGPNAEPDVAACPSPTITFEAATSDAMPEASIAEPAESAGPPASARPLSNAETPRAAPSKARTATDTRTDRRQDRTSSGQLTAGSIDDVERAEEFCRFLDRTLNSQMFSGAMKNVRPHVVLQLTTSDGLPVGGAEIVVKPDDFQREALRLKSGSDGRAMLTVSDLAVQTRRCEATIRPPGGGQPIREMLSLDDNVCHIVVPDVEAQRPRQLDLALVIDTTGSMGDELEYLKTEIDDIVARLRDTFPNVDQRFALIVYRDQGDQYVSRTFDFTHSLDDLRGELSRQHASGGGDHPEAVHVALQQAAGLDWRRGNVARVAFLVGDAPPHDTDMPAAFDAAGQLRTEGVRLYPVASSGAGLKAEFIMRSAAFLTMGQYLFLTDHSGIGKPHARPHTSQYLVEHLDQLMVRMITSELCGRRLQPDEVLAIERGDLDVPYGPALLPQQRRQWQQQNRPAQSASLALPEGVGMWLTLGAVLLAVFAYDSIRSGLGA